MAMAAEAGAGTTVAVSLADPKTAELGQSGQRATEREGTGSRPTVLRPK